MAKTVHHQDLKSFFGKEDHLLESTKKTFTELIFETLTENLPSPKEKKVFELILNLSIDHGPDTPSAIKTIEAAKEGKTISESLAAGVLQINNVHGGAIEPAMELFYGIQSGKRAEQAVKEILDQGKRVVGFGHRLYKDSDPRAQLIIKTMMEEGMPDQFIMIADTVEKALEMQSGKKLPLNIDGAIAIALCTMEWNPRLGKAVFLIARTPGLIAHFLNNSPE